MAAAAATASNDPRLFPLIVDPSCDASVSCSPFPSSSLPTPAICPLGTAIVKSPFSNFPANAGATLLSAASNVSTLLSKISYLPLLRSGSDEKVHRYPYDLQLSQMLVELGNP